MKEIINVGLIGYGLGGRAFHAPIIDSVPGLNLHKIYTTKKDYRQHINAKYKDVDVVSKLEDIIDDPSIKLVVIASPSPQHFENAKRILKSGKNVIVEKPFTATTQEADELITLAKETNKLLTVNHNRRFDSDFKTVKKIVEKNFLGEVVTYEANFDRFRPMFKHNWKEEYLPASGVLYDLGSHLIDQALCLFGLPLEVFANLEIQRPGGKIEDYFKLILRYPNLNVTLRAGSLVREVGPRYIIHGTKGSFIKYGLDVQEDDLKKELIPKNIEDWGNEPESIWGKINTEMNGLHIQGRVESAVGDYRELYRNVYESILGNEELLVKPQEARNVIRVIELAKQSNIEKCWIKFQL